VGSLTAAHLIWAKQAKTVRLQAAIAAHPAVAQSLLILALLAPELGIVETVRITPGAPFKVPEHDLVPMPALDAAIEIHLQNLRGDKRPGLATIFRRLLDLGRDSRLELLATLVARQCGTWPGWRPTLGDEPLVVAIAEACGLEPEPIVLTTSWLDRQPRARLRAIAGAADSAATRAALVHALAGRHYAPPELRYADERTLAAALEAEAAHA
jgi:hypothetical protein